MCNALSIIINYFDSVLLPQISRWFFIARNVIAPPAHHGLAIFRLYFSTPFHEIYGGVVSKFAHIAFKNTAFCVNQPDKAVRLSSFVNLANKNGVAILPLEIMKFVSKLVGFVLL